MKLWVRSQDKTKLVKVDNISYLDMAEDMDAEAHSLWNDCKGILGQYKSKERALEVLDEIQNRLNIRHNDRTGAEFIVISEIVPVIYEMPKE